MNDAKNLAGTWRLITIREDGKVRPERGVNPTGFITYHASGWMHVVIHPDRPSIEVKDGKPTGEQALAALYGYTSYFGAFSVDEAKKIVTHHRAASVQPGWQVQGDVQRQYRFDGPDRVILGSVGSQRELVWERLNSGDESK